MYMPVACTVLCGIYCLLFHKCIYKFMGQLVSATQGGKMLQLVHVCS